MTINPEAVKLGLKQVDLISRLYDVYHSMDSDMSLLNVHGHQNIRKPASTLTKLAFLNVRLDAPAEYIIAAFLLSSATINTTVIGL